MCVYIYIYIYINMRVCVCVYIYIYMYITSDMEKSEDPNMTATEHLNITKQMHIDGSSSICSAKCKQMYISASVNIVKNVHIIYACRNIHLNTFKYLNTFSLKTY